MTRPCPTPDKRAYATITHAASARLALEAEGLRGLVAYECPGCYKWHLGRRRKWKLPKIRTQRGKANRR